MLDNQKESYSYEYKTLTPFGPKIGVIKLNDFIRAKDRFINRDFPGVSYIECPPEDSDGSIQDGYEDFHICSLNPPNILDEH